MQIKKDRNKALGFLLLIFPIIFFISYTYILFNTNLDIKLMKVTILAVIGIIVTVFSWIGVTMIISANKIENGNL
ncbi:MAG: hypothetical protein DA328_03730 [Nitrososphaeraceae archaeon]|nr:hypothetical protein [Nitrososphaeraceae archaeon]